MEDKMGEVKQISGIPDVERLANFLAIQHSDCSLNCLPEKIADIPPLSGMATQESYLQEAEHILEMLGVKADQ
jgi:hypothetical protein